MPPHDPDATPNGTRIGGPARDGAAEPLEMGGVIIHPGARISGYIFLREIGSGGMARVLLAKDPDDQLIALKVLRASRFKTGLKRFHREYRMLCRIHHPNVVAVHTYGDLFGHPFIAMEYIDGPDLHTLIRQFRNWDPEDRWRRVEEILIDLCRALAAIHRHGLVHRDLKPSNVLINADGVCKLTDFGIVKNLDPTEDFMMSTTLVGTWAYASPEQIQGAPIDHRSDLYSLGVILFAMLTGKRPFVANDMAGYLTLHRDRAAPAPREVNRNVPEHLDEICRRLLQKAPRDRYQSAQEILYRLEAEDREATPSGDDAWSAPLVGRQLEIESITEAISGLTARRGGVLVLEGDDGSGKSRLLGVAVDRARSLGIPTHAIEFMANEEAFGSALALARSVERALDGAAPAGLTQAIASFEAEEASPVNARYALYDGVRDGLAALLDDQPQLLLLDDLHLAHPRFVELLTYLTRSLLIGRPLPLLVVTSLRPRASAAADAYAEGEELGLEPQRMAVGPLSRADITRIVRGLVDDELHAGLLGRRLHAETEGNAFFVVEFLRSLMARGLLHAGGDGGRLALEPDEIATGHLEIPLGVRQTMRSRLEGIADEDREALQVLAVAGREVDLDVLVDVLEADEEVVLDRVERLLTTGIVRERRAGDVVQYVVSHRKFADVVYRDLHPDHRARLHRRMAAALELHYAHNPAALEIVGEHYRRAGDAGRAYRYLVAAARRLRDRSLLQEAWTLTDKAAAIEESAAADLDAADFAGFRRDLLDVRAEVLSNRAEWAEAEASYRLVLRLAEEAHDARAANRARLDLARVLRRRRALEEAWKLAERALEESRRLHDREGVAEALLGMTGVAWSEGRLDDVERLANEGLLVARGPHLAGQRAELLLGLSASQATRGQLASATSGLTEAEAIFRELRRKRSRVLALSNLAELLTWQGQPLQARQRAHIAVQVAADLDFKLGRVVAQRAMGIASLDLGRYDDAREALVEALMLARQIDLSEEAIACETLLAAVLLEQGDEARATRFARQALARADGPDPERFRPLAQASLGHAIATTEPAEARASVAEAARALQDLPVPRRTQVELALARASLALDDPDAARRAARAVLQTAGSRGFRLLSLEARALLAQVTPAPEADTHRAVAQELIRDFTSGLSAELATSFRERPWVRGIAPAEDPGDGLDFEGL
jgi:tetratricopeptide (TPR) repeat protein/DNA-binding Lrp family transcriptional regulator